MRKCICICMCICICICICMWLYVYLYMYMYMPKARKPAQRFCVFFCVVICLGGWGGGGCNNVLFLRSHRVFFCKHTSCYVLHVSVVLRWSTLHVTLHTSVVLRWTHFMLRCTLLLYFGDQTSCYVAHFCCTSVSTLHVCYVVLRWHFMLFAHFCCSSVTHFMLRCNTSCCTSVNTLHVTLHTSVPVLRWPHFMLLARCTRLWPEKLCYVAHLVCDHSKGQFTKTVRRVQRGSPKVLAHTGTIDSCWKACKKMLPGSLSSQSPMIMTYVKAWQWRYIHRNADVCDITAKTVRKLKWWKRIAGAVAKRKTIQKT